jgi:CHAT domain-containing protein
MPEIRTDALRSFQKRVHDMNNANQRDLRLTAQEARNISNELSQLTAFLLQLQTNNNTQETINVTVAGLNF